MNADVFEAVCAMGDAARTAQSQLAQANTEAKNQLLNAIADALDQHADDIAAANTLDMNQAETDGMDAGKLDRLRFDQQRIAAAAQGVRHVASLPDPIGEIVRGYHLENGLRLQQVRVPIGVLGMIYEARPNVTVDVASLCIKSGNAVLLRGGHAAEHTNAATLAVIADVLTKHGYDHNMIATVDQYGRDGATAMMEARGHIDVLIPRGGAGLIQAVVRNSKVPVIETGAGNVHIYVDRTGNPDKAIPILINAKTQRVGVCNATEKLLVHKDIAESFLPKAAAALAAAGVEMHADGRAYGIIEHAGIANAQLVHATDEDWDTEYLALKIGIKVVDSLDEAIAHINRHSTGHTESIIAEDYSAIEEFTARIGGGDGQRLHTFHRWRRVRIRRGTWHLHTEDACARSDGAARDDHDQMDWLRNRTGERMSDEVMQDNMQHTMQDNKNPWNADLTDPMLRLRLASERLSIVRYVFLVQVEDGIASADERASLEYADAVLIGWPETDASDVITPDAAQLDDIDEQMRVMEQHIAKFSAMERDHDIVGMTDTLIRVTERVAGIRSIYQPDFPLPTFAEIRRVVQDEWDEDMDKIDPDNASPTADSIEQETADADKEQQAEKQAEQQADGAQKSGASA